MTIQANVLATTRTCPPQNSGAPDDDFFVATSRDMDISGGGYEDLIDLKNRHNTAVANACGGTESLPPSLYPYRTRWTSGGWLRQYFSAQAYGASQHESDVDVLKGFYPPDSG